MNLALIGNGKIVNTALDALQHIKDIQVKAICARPQSKGKAEAIAQTYHIPQVSTNYEELLGQSDIDFVYLGIINLKHYDYALQALQAGKNVILEKPSTLRGREMEELASLARTKGLYLFEAVTFLHSPFFRKIQDCIPQLGPVHLVMCNYSKYSTRYDQYLLGEVLPVFNPRLAGGCLLDMNIYCLNFAVSLFGKPVKTTYKANLGFNGVDTSGFALLEYPHFLCQCAAAKDSDSPSFMQIQGDKGWIKVEGGPDSLKCLHIHLQGKTETINLTTERNRMEDEFRDFLRIYQQKAYTEMEHWLNVSVSVAQVAEDAYRDAHLYQDLL